MTLHDLTDLREGAKFTYKGHPSIVRWTQLEQEEIDRDKDDKPLYRTNINICFDCPEMGSEPLTLHSDHPNLKLDLKEFTV